MCVRAHVHTRTHMHIGTESWLLESRKQAGSLGAREFPLPPFPKTSPIQSLTVGSRVRTCHILRPGPPRYLHAPVHGF